MFFVSFLGLRSFCFYWIVQLYMNRRKEIHEYLIDVLKHLQTVIEQQEYDAVIIIYIV